MPIKAQPQQNSFEKIRASPFYKVGLQAAIFAAGVWFIQSPLMDTLVPQI